MPSKYNNRRVKADGHTFDSGAEYRRYRDLLMLEQAGAIHKLKGLIASQFLRDTGTLQAGALLVAVGNFISAVGLAFLLGPARQGEFYVAISLYSFLWFVVNLGLVTVTVNKVSGALANGDRDEAASWLAYLLKAYTLLGALVGVMGWLILPWAKWHNATLAQSRPPCPYSYQ